MFFYFRFEQGQLIEGRCWVVFRFLLIRFSQGHGAQSAAQSEKQEPLLPAGSLGGEHSGPPTKQFINTAAAAECTVLPLQVTCRFYEQKSLFIKPTLFVLIGLPGCR